MILAVIQWFPTNSPTKPANIMKKLTLLAFSALAVGGQALAESIAIENYSFEDPLVGDPNLGWYATSGWGSTFTFTTQLSPPATQGTNAAYITGGFSGGSGGGIIYQILGDHDIVAGEYTFQIDLGQ